MRPKPKITLNAILAFLLNRTAPTLLLFYQLIILVGFALLPLFAVHWFRQPFLGGLLEEDLSISKLAPTSPGSWELQPAEVSRHDVLIAIGGKAVQNLWQVNAVLAGLRSGQRVHLTFRGSQQDILLQDFPVNDRGMYFVIPYIIGLVYLGSSIWIFSLRRGDPGARAFAFFSASLALIIAGFFEKYTTQILTPMWMLALAVAGGALFNLAMLFPEESLRVKRYPIIRWAGYIPSVALAFFALPRIYYSVNPLITAFISRLGFIYLGSAVLIFMVWIILQRFRSASPIAREQARLISWGSVISFDPLLIWFALSLIRPTVRFYPILLLPLAIFPALTGYSILRYRVLNTDYLLSRVTQYTILSLLAGMGYALLVSGFSLIFGSAMPSNHPLLIGLIVFIFAILLQPLRQRLQSYIDRLFFRGQAQYQELAQAFGRELTQTVDLAKILSILRSYITKGLYPSQFHIYVRDPMSGQYLPQVDENGQPSTDIHFPSNSTLVQALTQRRNAMFLGGSDTLPTLLQTERARLALLAVQLFVPLPGQTRLVGWIGLGTRLSGDPYTNNDLRYLESLCDQAALAVERAQVIGNLERRVHEMDVLTRIAQGINITLEFDDILELIYAQTNLLIPTQDMQVTLCNNVTGALFYAFNLKNDERLREQENIPLPEGQNLEEVVVRSRRALLTDDFERECHANGILAKDPEIFSWIGVPLNAGADIIGVISLGNRDPTYVFTEGQLTLLQAIADQAAGAIVKARLLQESERHARQMATLNEVGTSLTSMLELKPLLNKILVSAAEILNCEAGSLFMLDEQTNEMVFEVTFGPVAAELIGQRLPPGTGLVGKAVLSAQPVISNDVRKTQGWSDKTDQQTGFVTRDLLVVPMLVHDQVIGVIEIINKQDGSPFNQDDQELLATFASQAAVAVENARLYTQTDEALAARVQELSVMQRIDQELNASLDLERSMRITLEWAMRHAHVEAGLAGLLDPNDYKGQDGHPSSSIRVIAVQGYDGASDSTPKTDGGQANKPKMSLDLPGLQKAIETGLPQVQRETAPFDQGIESASVPQEVAIAPPVISGAKSQVVIPILRISDVIGVIVLETQRVDAFSDETIAFLTRLSDHAAIAISNAQLYADLQAANIAKSDFVSLVSHELKTPMTSIRGYADLLAQGVVGPVNEVQANFLNTIRSNVGRMATLVSDLADVSRIEAGRMRLDFSAVQLFDLVQEVLRSQQAQIDEKKQILSVQIPMDLPLVWGDRNRITQVLTNLVSNANKYTPTQGKISILAEKISNQKDDKSTSDVVRVSVQDSGFGISPKDQEKIFLKFFRSEDQNIRESAGTGLGLNITRHLVEMQGGSIWFESEIGKGTTFHFTIPVAATG
jgi:signal transduction histidine kinase